MSLQEQNILFFTRTMKVGGTENVILDMCDILKPYVNKIIVCSCGGINVKKLKQKGIKHYTIPDIEKKTPIVLLKTFMMISKIIKKEKITIVHTHHRMATFYMFILKKISKVFLISTLHGIFSDKKILTRTIYKKINIIACGEMVKEEFIKAYGISDNKIVVIKNSVKKDTNNQTDLDLLKRIPPDVKKIGYIGRLSSEKGVNVLIDAIPIIEKNSNNVHFIIVGSGDQENVLKEKVKRERLEEKVSFLGYREDAQNIMKQLDIIVLPSYTEGLPLTPIEAFAQGKPVVATVAGGNVEVVENNKNGLLVPIGDSDSLANAIIKLSRNKKMYDTLSRNALKTYTEKYSFNIFKNNIVTYYKKITEDCK